MLCTACRKGDARCCPRAEIVADVKYVSGDGFHAVFREENYHVSCDPPTRGGGR